MKNLSENNSFASKLKTKAAELTTKALIRQADEGIKFSIWLMISEAKIPTELMHQDTE